MNDKIEIIDIWEVIKNWEYHKNEKLLFVNKHNFEQFASLFDEQFYEGDLDLHFKGNYFCVNLEAMVDFIDEEFTEEIVKKMEESNE